MNKIKPILFSLVIAVFIVFGCKSIISEVQLDLSKKLAEYTECPKPPIFVSPLIETQGSITMSKEDFGKLDKYVINLEVCSAKRLLDIIKRNEIIQDLLKR